MARRGGCYHFGMSIADVLVLARDTSEVTLIAEIRMREPDASTVQQLKRYMLDRRCSMALLVTPTTTTLYRDTFADYTDATIVEQAVVSTAALLGLERQPSSERELEQATLGWLDRLAGHWESALPDDADARRSVVAHVVPLVAEGRVMFAHGA